MDCKRVYDPVGYFSTDGNGNAFVKAMVLLPHLEINGRYQKLTVNKSEAFNISNQGYYGFLIVIECVGQPGSLKEEAISDFLELEFTIKNEEIPDFPNGKLLRLIVVHSNEFMADPENDYELIPCAKKYMEKVGFDLESKFDEQPDLPCIVPYGPKKLGESILPGI
ncbi:MAG: hypothetical protein AAF039_08400 [Bacteroidota bacterium]